MQTWSCGHEGEEGHSRLCPHLVGAELANTMYFRVFRGKRLESDFCCRSCGELLNAGGTIEWLSVCSACVEQLEENEGDVLGWIGQPEIKERHLSFDANLSEFALPDEIAKIVALAPLSERHFVCYGNLNLFLIDEERVTSICPVSLPDEKDSAWAGHHLTPRIHVSMGGRFAVVCHDYGRFGQVLDLQTTRVTMQLDSGDYHPETQPFPVAFFQNNGRTLLAHGARWNRLEISDPQTGELLTPRDEMIYKDETQPDHYLDFFHGSLLVSPNGAWVADDGWVWHPVGEVTTWNLNDWLDNNLYESEDGTSRRLLCWRDYLWNVPIAWIDNERVAVWGIGVDEELMLNGARVFDVSTGEETATFAGPSQITFFGGEGRLFSVEEDGLHIWDAGNGERLGRINGFKPRWQRGDFLIELNENRVRSWNWLTAFK